MATQYWSLTVHRPDVRVSGSEEHVDHVIIQLDLSWRILQKIELHTRKKVLKNGYHSVAQIR